MRSRNPWRDDEIELLRELYPDTPTKDIAHRLGRDISLVYGKAAHLALKKSDQYLAGPDACRLRRGDNVGAAHRFKLGHKSWNKGLSYMPRGGSETFFRKGHKPHNSVSVGTRIVDGDGYVKVKIAEPKEWGWLHKMVWVEEHGPIPAGMCVVFKDRNRENCQLDNLELIDRAELARRNSINRYPLELKQTFRLIGKLKRKIDEKQNC